MVNNEKIVCEKISEIIWRYKIKDCDIILEEFGNGKGKIIISNPYGYNYSYFWGSMDSDLKHFICNINEFYFADKLLGSRSSNEMDCKKTFTAIRKFIREEFSLPWYKHQEFQKNLREILNSFQRTCEDVSGNYKQNYFVDNFFRSFVDRLDYYLIKDRWNRKEIEDSFKGLCEQWNFIIDKPNYEYVWLSKLHKQLKKQLIKDLNKI
jgi:hypothetical protein